MMVIEFGTPWGVRRVELLPDAGAGFMIVLQHNGVNIGRATVPTDTLHGQRAAEAFVRALLDSTGIRFSMERVIVTPGIINVITPPVVTEELQ